MEITVEEMMQTNHGSRAKKSTFEHNPNPNPNPDLISALPDSLLLHILSLLTMDKVMKTSLLSKRWRYVWKFIPCLCFKPYGSLSIKLTNFIDRCLFHHEGSKIHKLHINLIYDDDDDDDDDNDAPLVDSWLHFAIRRKVEDFHLQLSGRYLQDWPIVYDEFYKIPHSLYFCGTLTSLTLSGCNLNLPRSFKLASLKKLELQYLELYIDSIERLSSSCPILEDIHLMNCNSGRDLNIVITSLFVKRLEISCYGQCGLYDKIKINAPTLLLLVIDECCPTVMFDVMELGSLMSADLIADQYVASCYYDIKENINSVGKLLYDLRHVKQLKLCGLYLQVLSLAKLRRSGILSISATCLELNTSLEKWAIPGISYLLESCSNLQKLKIVNENYYTEIELNDEFIHDHDFEEEKYWESFETGVTSIMQKIQIIEIDLEGKSRPEEFVRFLLKNAKVLERMVINTPKGYDKYNFELLFKFCQRLNAFPRSSPNAKLFIT